MSEGPVSRAQGSVSAWLACALDDTIALPLFGNEHVIAPLVVESSGLVSPSQYGFPRTWAWGNVNEASLPELAGSWLLRDYPAFLALRRSLYERPVVNEDEPVLNWYQHIHAAAERVSPQQGGNVNADLRCGLEFKPQHHAG